VGCWLVEEQEIKQSHHVHQWESRKAWFGLWRGVALTKSAKRTTDLRTSGWAGRRSWLGIELLGKRQQREDVVAYKEKVKDEQAHGQQRTLPKGYAESRCG